jgi:hypothetical protein
LYDTIDMSSAIALQRSLVLAVNIVSDRSVRRRSGCGRGSLQKEQELCFGWEQEVGVMIHGAV